MVARLLIEISGTSYEVETDNATEVSIPLKFSGPQPNHFGVAPARSQPLRMGDFVGDIREGGGCNVAEISFIPHCNGTHTEGIGHIAEEAPAICEVLKEWFIPTTLVSVQPQAATATEDRYLPGAAPDDRLITRAVLQSALRDHDEDFRRGLAIRTLPNAPDKQVRQYLQEPPPYFSLQAMELIVDLGVEHLLVDIPSVDRMHDEGRLEAHHLFWNIASGEHRLRRESHRGRTITEMIYLPDSLPDGRYLAHIQIPGFESDAAPSRVFLFPLRGEDARG